MLTEGGTKVQMLRKEFVWICYKNLVKEGKKIALALAQSVLHSQRG